MADGGEIGMVGCDGVLGVQALGTVGMTRVYPYLGLITQIPLTLSFLLNAETLEYCNLVHY